MRSLAVRQSALAALILIAALLAFRLVETLVTPRFDFQIGLDGAIPLIPWTIFVYQSFFFFVVIGALFLHPDEFRRTFLQIGVAVVVGFACFVVFPASMSRPDASQIADPFLRQRFLRLWWLDETHNTFPSLHVAITWIAAAALRVRFAKRGLAKVAVALAVAISVSTLTVKQHAVVDVLGGLVLASLVLALVAPRHSGASTALSWRQSLAALSADWLLIVFAFACAIVVPHPATYVFAVLLIARTQLALAVLMHESAHGLLFRRKVLNDVIGQVFTAAPLLVSLSMYRYGHLKHHRHPMVHDDPVAVVFEINDYPISRRRLALRLARDLFGVSNLVNVYRFQRGDYRSVFEGARKRSKNGLLVTASIIVTQVVMLAVLTWLGHGWLYVALWLVPLLTLFQVMGRVRAIMEHAGYPASEDQTRNARTIVRPNWQTFFFGPHGVHFHIEHHHDARVPFYRLPAIHRTMLADGRLPTENLYRGYGAILRDVTH